MKVTQKILSHIYFLSKVLPKAAQVSHVHNTLPFLPQNNKVLVVGQVSWVQEVFKMISDKDFVNLIAFLWHPRNNYRLVQVLFNKQKTES